MPKVKPRIAIDAMGADGGPAIVIPGALRAAKSDDLTLLLAGDSTAIQKELARYDTGGVDIEIVHAAEAVGMTEKPSDVLRRKKNSSIQIACRLVKEGRAEGMVSGGNSGATVACGMFIIGRAPGVSRAAFASILPTLKKPVVLLDVGANVDSKPEHLLQFAVLGEVLAKVIGSQKPRIGLLSIGEEEGKGNIQVKEAFDLIKASSIPFVGNVEGRDIFTGDVEVVVCDGFVGNVSLKLAEGMALSMHQMLKRELKASLTGRLGALLAQGSLRRFLRHVDYAEYGGAPLLGLQGTAIACHGASSSRAITSAVKMAGQFIRSKANEQIQDALARYHA